MASTTTVPVTLQQTLDVANPVDLADALRKVKLGTLLTPTVYTSGTIGAIAAVPLPVAQPALVVMSARVLASGTAASVGTYMVGDAGSTPTLPTGGASAGVGIASLSADGSTITFPNTVTSVVVQYLPRSAAPITGGFNGDLAAQ